MENAKKVFTFFINLENTNFETELIKQFNYFDINRWDIILKNDKVVKLPTNNYEKIHLKSFCLFIKKKILELLKFLILELLDELILK